MESMNETRTSAQRYVDILTEAGFKAVFGVEKNKDVLIDLLNIGVPKFDRSDNEICAEVRQERQRNLEGQVCLRIYFPRKSQPRSGG